MKKLAEKEYWDLVHKGNFNDNINKSFLIKSWVKKQTRDYSNFLIWEVIIPKYLPKNNNFKIMEIGCAPGKYLINFYKQFGYEPYGVEYSEKGVEITKKNFLSNNLNSDNIIHADFFDSDFQTNNKNKYDVIFSRGFIEHFDNVKGVVNLHKNLLNKNGYMVVMIPNLNGLNKIFAKILNKKSYDLHNTEIMDKNIFSKLFLDNNLEEIYCNYVGLFSFGLFNTNKKWKYILWRLLLLVQRPFDFLLRILRLDYLRNKYLSPYLIFIGRKF